MKSGLYSLITAIFSIIIVPAQSQWTQVSSLVHGSDTAGTVSEIRGFGSVLYASTNLGLFISNDNGSTWSNITKSHSLTSASRIFAAFADSTGLYAAGDSNVYFSADNGGSWSVRNPVKVNGFERFNGKMLASYGSFGSGGVYYSDDNLQTLTPATIDNKGYWTFFVDGSTLYAGGQGGAARSSDGINWTVAGTGLPFGRFGNIVRSGTSLFGNDLGGSGLYRSKDNGASWANTDTSTFKGFCQVFGLATNGITVLAVMDGACSAGNPVKISEDNGDSWAPYMTGLTPGYYPTLGTNASGSCYFLAGAKRVYKSCTGTMVAGIKMPECRVYPNPVSDKLYISKLPPGSGMKLTDPLGRIHSLSFVAEECIDMSLLSPGTYMLLIETPSGTALKRIIKQ